MLVFNNIVEFLVIGSIREYRAPPRRARRGAHHTWSARVMSYVTLRVVEQVR